MPAISSSKPNNDKVCVKSYQKMWRAVLIQAFMDLGKCPPSSVEYKQAVSWFRLTCRDFVFVCEQADVCEKKALKAAQAIIKGQKTWHQILKLFRA